MPEIIFNGPAGRLEGRYQPGKDNSAPVALILHQHPQYGGNMDNKVAYYLYHIFAHRGFATLRFNFRGIGRSQGEFDNGVGELSDAAAALDWLQSMNANSSKTWIAGFSFGAWIAMQLLMRRPEIEGFISVAPPANLYDFSFLAPCPSSGLIVQAEDDDLVTPHSIEKLVEKLHIQKQITIDHSTISGANHFFENELQLLVKSVNTYLNKRLGTP
ncbi:alpha/beta hydrolase [Kordiimonas sediminis]|uniref:Alpha/beta hydrolase n=1 Tax=Kordiimonas sediminis TaxID=1735581 RepID=A0A919AX28_9PROT|nr:alpha/beta hydrolase [Kordiimonas sediminis]GHF27517.1 alpha/beta hydrolase [Kordiimonas sediminis]